jgi:hypothetical protein
MVKKTFDDFHPLTFNKDSFNIEEYMDLVETEKLEKKFSTFLEKNEWNLLNQYNMPWLDIGELPISYHPDRTEAFQVFIQPNDNYPTSMIIDYDEWEEGFDTIKLKKEFNETIFLVRGLTENDIEDTLKRASILLYDYRGKISRQNRMQTYFLIGGFFLSLILAVIIGFFAESWFWCAFIIVVYIMIVFIVQYVMKTR